jgi:CubicO group peptidase (beta-lactamase class C family)
VFEKAAAERDRWGIPGLAVGLRFAGSTDARGFGVTAVEDGAPVSPATSFRIASITKPFVATLASLVLDLDEALETPAGPATPRQLLSHSAGLHCEAAEPFDPEATLADALEGCALSAFGRPGELYAYSNAGFWLVGAAIERATGLGFEEALRERVLDPLGLASTGFGPPTAPGHEPVGPGELEHRPFPGTRYPVGRRPSGGLVSTVGDLLRFGRHHLAEPSLAFMRKPLIAMPGGSYGLGWMLTTRGEAILVFHPGSVAGYQSLLLLVPERDFAFAALSNSARGSAAIDRVCGFALRELCGLPREEPVYVELSREALAALSGCYRQDRDEAVVSAEDGRIRVELVTHDPLGGDAREPPLLARPVGEREFVVVEGESKGHRFDFPGRFLRMGSLLERVDE